MGSGLSSTLESQLLDQATGKTAYTAPSALYLALVTNAGGPTAATTPATMTEPVYTTYARQPIATSIYGAAASGSMTNTGAGPTFTLTSGTPAPITGFCIVEVATGTTGRVLWYGRLLSGGSPVDFTMSVSSPTLSFAASSMPLALPTGSGVGGYASNKLLELSIGKTAWTLPSLWMALCTSVTAASSYVEAAYTGYARVAATTFLSAAAGSSPASSTNSANGGDITFPISTGGATPAVSHWVLLDSGTIGAGNMVFWETMVSTVTIASGQTPKIAASTLTISLT